MTKHTNKRMEINYVLYNRTVSDFGYKPDSSLNMACHGLMRCELATGTRAIIVN